MTVDEYVERLIAALRKHDTEASFHGAYIDPDMGCIDGYFDLRAVAREMLQPPPVPELVDVAAIVHGRV